MLSIFRTEDTCSRGCLTLAGIAGLVIWVYSTIWGAGFVGGLILGLICAILGGAALRWLICEGRQAQPGSDIPSGLPVAVTRGADWGQHVRNVFTEDKQAPEGAADAPVEEVEPPQERPVPIAAAVAGTAEPVSFAALPDDKATPLSQPDTAQISAEESNALASRDAAVELGEIEELDSSDAVVPAFDTERADLAAPQNAPVDDPDQKLMAAVEADEAATKKKKKDKTGKGRNGKEKAAKDKPGKDKKAKDGKGKKDKKARKDKDKDAIAKAATLAQPAETVTTPEAPVAPRHRAVTPDDLKEIKGIGPKYEKMLNDLGYRTFAQVAAWTEADIARMQDAMPNFDNRIRSEDWIGQAAELAGKAGKERE